MNPQNVSHCWRRIEQWLQARGKVHELTSPASQEEIAALEQHLGMRLLPEHTELLLGHNGGGSFALPPYYEILGTSEIRSIGEVKVDVWSEDVHPYSSAWVPFAADRAGGVLYLDTASSQAPRIHAHDREGQNNLTDHPMWNSLTSVMHYTADALESGQPLDGYLPPVEGDFTWSADLED